MKQIVCTFLMALLVASMPLCAQDYPIEVINGVRCYKYTVQKGEGFYRISKNFGVSQEEIVKLNPRLQTDGLRLDDVIYIPVVEQPVKADTEAYIQHVVQPKETLYGLSKKYGVSQTDILALNKEAAQRMAIGSILLIPQSGTTIAAAPAQEPSQPVSAPAAEPKATAPVESETAPSTATLTPMPAMQMTISEDSFAEQPKDEIQNAVPMRIAYLLPLMAANSKRDDRFVEFYEGALLAIKKMQPTGQKIEIYTYDIEKSDEKLNEVLASPELQNVDLIIGPAYPSQVKIVGNFAYINHIPTIVPFTSHVAGIESNPYLMQFNPAEEQEAEALCSALLEQKSHYRYLFVDGGKEEKTTLYASIENMVKKQGLPSSQVSVHRILADSLPLELSAERTNVFVVNTDKVSNLQTLLPKMEEAARSHAVVLVGKYSYTKENLLVDLIYSSVFNEVENQLLLAEYNELFNKYFTKNVSTDAPRYDLLGYDITCYALRYLQDKFSSHGEKAEALSYQGLQSNIHFMHVPGQEGYQNSEIQVVQINTVEN